MHIQKGSYVMRERINQMEQAMKQRDKGYFFLPSGIQTMDKNSARDFAESMLDACDKAELYEKDYVVEVTPKGTWYSAPYNGEDTSGVVILFVNPTNYTDGDKIVNL